jgi:hypothetical protein
MNVSSDSQAWPPRWLPVDGILVKRVTKMTRQGTAALLAAMFVAAGSSVLCPGEVTAKSAGENGAQASPLRPPGMAERAWLARQEATRTRFVALIVSAVVLTLFCLLWLRFRRRKLRGSDVAPKTMNKRSREDQSGAESAYLTTDTEEMNHD